MTTAQDNGRDYLDEPWCCLACRWKGRLGNVKLGGKNPQMPYCCPVCGSDNIHPAGGDVVVLDAYYGEIGTRN